jgi:hypothetical protein
MGERMNYIECFEKEGSIRPLADQPVPEKVIDGALLVANLAISGGYMRPGISSWSITSLPGSSS